MPGLADGGVNGVGVGRESSVAMLDGHRLRLRHQRGARATDDHQREAHERQTRAQHGRDSPSNTFEQHE
jgi:hypothetical protein